MLHISVFVRFLSRKLHFLPSYPLSLLLLLLALGLFDGIPLLSIPRFRGEKEIGDSGVADLRSKPSILPGDSIGMTLSSDMDEFKLRGLVFSALLGLSVRLLSTCNARAVVIEKSESLKFPITMPHGGSTLESSWSIDKLESSDPYSLSL